MLVRGLFEWFVFACGVVCVSVGCDDGIGVTGSAGSDHRSCVVVGESLVRLCSIEDGVSVGVGAASTHRS